MILKTKSLKYIPSHEEYKNSESNINYHIFLKRILFNLKPSCKFSTFEK